MAEYFVNNFIQDDVYCVLMRLLPDSLTQAELHALRKHGEPYINIGGTFLAGTPDQFSLPDRFVRVRADFPHTQRFDSRDAQFAVNTPAKAEAWKNAVLASLSEAFAGLRGQPDTFTKNELETV